MGDIVHTIAMGLTYDGEIMHILINYALIALTVAPFLLPRSPGTGGISKPAWRLLGAFERLF